MMINRKIRLAFSATALCLALAACGSAVTGTNSAGVSESGYAQSRNEKGVVLLSVNWQRAWGCASFDNVELLTMGFDRLPLAGADNAQPEFFLDGPPRLTKAPGYFQYAALLSPGKYALTEFDIKAARSASDVGHFAADRALLAPPGKAPLGTFDVRAGEVVYIGHFYVDCAVNGHPNLWRYYLKDRKSFADYIAQAKAENPFLDASNVQYRLFKTETFGTDFDLP